MDPNELFLRFVGAVCDGDRATALSSISRLEMEEGTAYFPRQDDGSKTPIPSDFIRNLAAMLDGR